MTEGTTEDTPGTLVAIVLPSLFEGTVSDATAADEDIIQVALEWQKISRSADLVEVAAFTFGIEEGRLTEFVGRIASAGEQLGLADAASRDARAWVAAKDQNARHGVGGRAMAEITGYFAISAAHGLANVTLRALLLNQTTAAVINSKYKRAQGFPPFSTNPDCWLPLNDSVVAVLEASAATVSHPSVADLVQTLRTLVDDPRWRAVADRRNIDFHRWRPQSIEGGVTAASPWQQLPGGQRQLTVSAGNSYVVPNHVALVAEAVAGLEALGEAMDAWLDAMPAALTDLGVQVFKSI